MFAKFFNFMLREIFLEFREIFLEFREIMKTKISQPPYLGVQWGGGRPVQPWRILRANEDCPVFVFRFPFCHL